MVVNDMHDAQVTAADIARATTAVAARSTEYSVAARGRTGRSTAQHSAPWMLWFAPYIPVIRVSYEPAFLSAPAWTLSPTQVTGRSFKTEGVQGPATRGGDKDSAEPKDLGGPPRELLGKGRCHRPFVLDSYHVHIRTTI